MYTDRLLQAEGGDAANAGLQHARVFLEPVREKHPWISYADLWTLAAVVALREMGGPLVKWLPGRTDFVDDSKLPPRGRLPDGAQGADHIRFIFYRMGFNDQEIVALSGAHNLGRMHMDRSGFHGIESSLCMSLPEAITDGIAGPWVPNPTRFSNTYFKLMTEYEWKEKTLENGVKQFVYKDEDLDEELAMLPTDLALIKDESFGPWVEKYAKDKELFFDHFSKAFGKLMELGIQRDANGNVMNSDNVKGGYHAAPKKASKPGKPRTAGDGIAEPLQEENARFKARL
jgi:cytochrome c peroxidase